jgi:hypothetical protein
MKRMMSAFAQAFLYFCVATVVAAGVGVVMLYQKGAFSDERVLNMWAALHGIDLPGGATSASGDGRDAEEQPAYEDILTKRTLAALDLDLRENTLDKALGELRTIELKIRTEQERFDKLVVSYEDKLKGLEANAGDAAILETQRTLEALPPKQAKQQLLNLLEESPSPGIESPMAAVVALVKAMPIERRRKILQEFKTEAEDEKLAEILKEILRGAPDVPFLKQAREELQNLNPKSKQPGG